MIKVLVVDDSAFMRQIYKRTINQDPELAVIATARNGADALKLIPELKPDVITLDVEMPVKNGMETLKEIVKLPHPIPVIMVSALDSRDTVMQALELGAFDFIPKPSGSISLNIDDITEQLILKIKAAAVSKSPITKKEVHIKPYTKKITRHNQKDFPVVAIATSSGGPKALKEVLPAFPGDFPAAIIVVQHMPAGFTASLAKRLDQESAIDVKEAEEGDKVKPGTALIAPGDYHLLLDRQERITLNQAPPKWGVRPCADYMLAAVAKIFQDRVIGVVLTGMGHDGAQGMKEIKKYHGYGIVQDKETALVYGMPSATIKENAYDQILPLEQIPYNIIELIERRF